MLVTHPYAHNHASTRPRNVLWPGERTLNDFLGYAKCVRESVLWQGYTLCVESANVFVEVSSVLDARSHKEIATTTCTTLLGIWEHCREYSCLSSNRTKKQLHRSQVGVQLSVNELKVSAQCVQR